ncbi:hypothetical protein ZWY2020_026084 [Hordeum vulgare]|nr:hypothetical protein ZWY2020_026084 [Hordeum vulgare]
MRRRSAMAACNGLAIARGGRASTAKERIGADRRLAALHGSPQDRQCTDRRGREGEMGSVVLATRRKREVDAAIRDTLGKVLVLRFGRASHSACLQLDDVIAKSSWDISKFARVALVDMDSEEIQVSHEHMSALLLDIIVDKHAIDIEPDYLKAIKVNCISL